MSWLRTTLAYQEIDNNLKLQNWKQRKKRPERPTQAKCLRKHSSQSLAGKTLPQQPRRLIPFQSGRNQDEAEGPPGGKGEPKGATSSPGRPEIKNSIKPTKVAHEPNS